MAWAINVETEMSWSWTRAVGIALAIYGLLLALAITDGLWRDRRATADPSSNSQSQNIDGKGDDRKNYASFKQKSAAAGQPIGDVQKYEKIASLTQRTAQFDADRARIDAAITSQQGVIQIERGSGLAGRRILHLGIGIPPDRFDAFIEAARAIGKTALITTVKNDKTNEYLQLRARRATLDKARAALEALAGPGGSIDERMKVQNRLAEIEEKIQELGVSLGEFDTQNELCTVKLTLEELVRPVPASMIRIIADAVAWATLVYAGIGTGFAALVAGLWAVMLVAQGLRRMAAGRDL
jgi:Domain of unknown function (DUF4349)